MQFEVKNLQRSVNDIMRQIGYTPAYFQKEGEFSIVRQVARTDYPRFHLYVKQNGQDFSFNLHLDQKKPSYGGSHAHSGEYDSEVVKSEAERIKNLLM